ncbi:MAG: sulfotransferase [Gammaproteobacteria bacterium]
MSEPGTGESAPAALQLLREAEALLQQRKPAAAERMLHSLVSAAPEMGPAWSALGRALNNLGRLPDAETALLRAAELDPGEPAVWLNLAHVRRGLGKLAEAGLACQHALALVAHDSAEERRGRRLLASVYLLQGEAEQAGQTLEPVVQANPGDPEVLREYADTLRGQRRLQQAREIYLRCLELAPEDHDARAALGIVCHGLDDHAAAAACFRQVLGSEPTHEMARDGLIWTLELQQEFAAVLDLLQPILAARPPAWAVITAGRMLRRLDRPDEANRVLRQFDASRCSAEDRATIHATLGEVLDASGDYAAAFSEFAQANACLPSRFDPDGFRTTVDRLCTFFGAERLAQMPSSGVDSGAPVFIVGMPRSGTSLVEQILGCHPQVESGGERTDIYRLPRTLSDGEVTTRWPECLLHIDQATLERLAHEYLEAAPGWDRGPDRITDKLPANYLNLGLIQVLLPAARVIYCRRDPMDTGLSCFQQNFRSEGMDFARDLGHIGLQQQGCWRLMAHWQKHLTLPIHVLDYERMIEEPEVQARALVQFVGLPWDKACLDFHRSARLVRTASYEQVRQPIYSSSVERWRNYEPWLRPLAAALNAPWTENPGG